MTKETQTVSFHDSRTGDDFELDVDAIDAMRSARSGGAGATGTARSVAPCSPRRLLPSDRAAKDTCALGATATNADGPLTDTGFSVRRISNAPIIAAGAVAGYGSIFNAGVIHHDGRFHLFARGVRSGYRRNDSHGPRFLDYISDVLVFTSGDGRSYEFQQVLAESGEHGVHCYEDPRVQRLGSGDGERIVMSYTNLPPPESGEPWRIGVHRLGYADGRFFLNRTSCRVIGPETEPNKDAVLFNLRDGRVGLIHRIHPNIQLALFDTLDELWEAGPAYWDEHLRELDRHTILRPSEDALGIGAGAPPLATADGLLLFFHERERSGRYTMRVALLEDETGRVRSVLPKPIMLPSLAWERFGDVDNVVFVQGALALEDGTIYLTYGASDRHVGAATVEAAPLLAALAKA